MVIVAGNLDRRLEPGALRRLAALPGELAHPSLLRLHDAHRVRVAPRQPAVVREGTGERAQVIDEREPRAAPIAADVDEQGRRRTGRADVGPDIRANPVRVHDAHRDVEHLRDRRDELAHREPEPRIEVGRAQKPRGPDKRVAKAQPEEDVERVDGVLYKRRDIGGDRLGRRLHERAYRRPRRRAQGLVHLAEEPLHPTRVGRKARRALDERAILPIPIDAVQLTWRDLELLHGKTPSSAVFGHILAAERVVMRMLIFLALQYRPRG